jgi:hypothetical protein
MVFEPGVAAVLLPAALLPLPAPPGSTMLAAGEGSPPSAKVVLVANSVFGVA